MRAEGSVPLGRASRNGMNASLQAPNGQGASAQLGVGVAACERAEGLAAITENTTELVIWQRQLPLCLKTWLEKMSPERLPDLRVLVRPQDLRLAVDPLLEDCGIAACGLRDLLISDIANLVSAFAAVTRSDYVDVRLECIDDDACRKFHRDCVEARLLTTYLGPATQWVLPQHAEQALREQERYEGPMEQLGLHHVALFKGSCAGPGSGIVHRSPPIAGTGKTRLLLCLNEPSAASPDLWPD